MSTYAGAIFISFDAVAVSGITVEAIKIAKDLARHGIVAYLDLGYDIKIDKGRFNQPYDHEHEIYQGVFALVRVEDITSVPYYNIDFITRLHRALVSQKEAVSPEEQDTFTRAVDESAEALSGRIIQLWEKLEIGHVIVENGTLPENIIYTKALYRAIGLYGQRHRLGSFVIWRDHDLMWNSEKTVKKYGEPPYPHAVKPIRSRHITYVTLNSHLKSRLEEWCHHGVEVHVKKNTYDFSERNRHTNLRAELSIRATDVLIARTTRIIPQKRLDRDVHLVHRLNHSFAQNGADRRVFLVIAGDPNEDRACYQGIKALAASLGVQSFVKFAGALQHDDLPAARTANTIQDLYHSCDLVSFLTSWDYDSYGNPVGEAISAKRCYIATSYEYYWEVYGQHGFEAPIMKISADHDGLPDDAFVDDLYRFLNNKKLMLDVAEKNFMIGKKVLSDGVADILNLTRL